MQRALQAFILPETLALNNAERSCWGCRPRSACVCPCTRARKGGQVWGVPYGGLSLALAKLELSEESCAILGFALALLFKLGPVSTCVSSGFLKNSHR